MPSRPCWLGRDLLVDGTSTECREINRCLHVSGESREVLRQSAVVGTHTEGREIVASPRRSQVGWDRREERHTERQRESARESFQRREKLGR